MELLARSRITNHLAFSVLSGSLINLAAFAMSAPPEEKVIGTPEGQVKMSSRGDGRLAKIDVECESLIAQLKSGRPAPAIPTRGHDPLKPPQRVSKIVQRLNDYGTDAFPALIKHSKDTDYSYRVVSGNSGPHYPRIYSVGGVCEEVIISQVDLVGMSYKGRRGADGREHGYESFFDHKEIADWWEARKTKTLGELRLEIVRWYIRHEKDIGFPTRDDEDEYLKPLLELESKVKQTPQHPRGGSESLSYPLGTAQGSPSSGHPQEPPKSVPYQPSNKDR